MKKCVFCEKKHEEKNSFCKKCFKIKAGCTKNMFLERIKNILYRRPQKPLLKYKSSLKNVCKYLCKYRCVYCTSKIQLTHNQIIPNKGYILPNVQILCWVCNRMKSNLRETEFFSHIKRVFEVNHCIQ